VPVTPFDATPTPRREFIGQVAAAAAALSAAACAAPAAAIQAAAAPAPRPPVKWDDAWTARITGKHKGVFDAPEIAEGTVIANANVWMKANKDVYGLQDSDLSAVLVVRHSALPMFMDDWYWDRYDLGKLMKVKDDATRKWAKRNPFWKPEPGAKGPNPYTFESLNARGCILIGCNLAAMGLAYEAAEKTKAPIAEMQDEVKAHLIPGVTLAPNGVFAVMRAQEAGCTYMRSA